jgi:hypothetical protein
MNVDDDRERLREKTLSGLWRRIAGAVGAVLLLIVCYLGMLRWPDGEPGPVKVAQDRIVATAALSACLLLLGWAAFAAVRAYVRHWRAVLGAEIVPATIVDKHHTADGEGGDRWDVRVTGRTLDGQTSFNRKVYAGVHDPGPIGTSIRVRYHAGLRRISTVERGPLAVVTSVIGHLLAVGGIAVLLYAAWSVARVAARLWW